MTTLRKRPGARVGAAGAFLGSLPPVARLWCSPVRFRTAKQEEQQVLDTLELFGAIFITISLFPLLLTIMLVVLQLLGRQVDLVLYATRPR